MNWNWKFKAVWMLCLGVNDMSREMKDSGVEWIGRIPGEWKVIKLSKLCSIVTGCTPDKGKQNFYYSDMSGIPWIKAENLGKGISINHTTEYLTDEGCNVGRVFPANTVYVCCIASVGKVGYSTISASCNQQINALMFNDLYDWKYGYYVTLAQQEEYNIQASGNVMKIINSDKQKSLMCPLPNVNEQKRIVKFLNKKEQYLNLVIEQIHASIEEYKKIKQSIITKVVTKGIFNRRKITDSGVAWLGNIPEEWRVYRIANLYQERSESGLEDLPILTVSINTGVSDREIADEEKDRVFVRSEDRTKYKRVYPGDLVYNMMRAWQGAFGAVRVEGMVSPAYVVAKPKDGIEIDSRYMEALLRTSEATEEMHRYSRGIVDFRLRLYWPEFKNIRICLPPIEEQREIADYIDRKNEEINRLIKKKEQFISELENYKKSLIYEYVTGKKEVPES